MVGVGRIWVILVEKYILLNVLNFYFFLSFLIVLFVVDEL